MDKNIYDSKTEIAWCPGCGNFGILNALKDALVELEIAPKNLVIVSGIGQAGKTPHYLSCNFFNGLHGRALPPATGIKAANPNLTVIAEGGDGDMYGEGGNHFLHAIRRNPNMTHLVHNNMIYGLTKGQASPMSRVGLKTPVQVDGVYEEPIQALAIAISQGASFVARTFSGEIDRSVEMIKQAILHKGYALVDIFQPCVTFNHLNTFKWYKDHTYFVDENYDPYDRAAALQTVLNEERFALGVLYKEEKSYTFDEKMTA